MITIGVRKECAIAARTVRQAHTFRYKSTYYDSMGAMRKAYILTLHCRGPALWVS